MAITLAFSLYYFTNWAKINKGGEIMTKNNQRMMQIKSIVFGKTFVIGFFGGVFLTLYLSLIHYFNMIEVNVFTPWKTLFNYFDVSTKWYMYPIWVIGYGLLSIMFALIYYIVMKSRNHWDIGALYGFAIGVVIYIFLPIVLYDQHFLQEYLLKTHISFFVALILYGIFIGYSISYEYARLRSNVQQKDVSIN